MTDTVIPVSLPHPIIPYADGYADTPQATEDEYYSDEVEEISPATTNTCPLCGFWKFSVMATCSLCHEHLLTGGAWDDCDTEAAEEEEEEEEYICRGCGVTFLDDGSANGFCSPRCAGGRSCYCCYR